MRPLLMVNSHFGQRGNNSPFSNGRCQQGLTSLLAEVVFIYLFVYLVSCPSLFAHGIQSLVCVRAGGVNNGYLVNNQVLKGAQENK